MQQTPSKIKIFRESCIFFAVTALLPVLGVLGFWALYEHSNPGDGIGQGLLTLFLVMPFCLVGSLVLGLITLKRLPILGTIKWAVFIPLVLAYASYYLTERYHPHITDLGALAILLVGTVLLPSAITGLTATLRKWRGITVAIVTVVIVFVPLLIGSYRI